MKKITSIIIVFSAILVSGCTQPISDEEKEFNASGRAKAIEDETDLWMFHEDEKAGFSIKYPSDEGLDIEVASVAGLEGTMATTKRQH